MTDSLLTKFIDGINIVLGTALVINGIVEYEVLYREFENFGPLVEKWLFPFFIMVFGVLMQAVTVKKDLVLVYFSWFASHCGRALWYFFIASLLVSMTKGQGYVNYAPWLHFLTAGIFAGIALMLLVLHLFVENIKIVEKGSDGLLAKVRNEA